MKNFYLSLLLFVTPFLLLADPPGPPGPGGNPGGSGGVPVGSPIDSLTIVLLVIAAGYGIYKLVEFRKNRKIDHLKQ